MSHWLGGIGSFVEHPKWDAHNSTVRNGPAGPGPTRKGSLVRRFGLSCDCHTGRRPHNFLGLESGFPRCPKSPRFPNGISHLHPMYGNRRVRRPWRARQLAQNPVRFFACAAWGKMIPIPASIPWPVGSRFKPCSIDLPCWATGDLLPRAGPRRELSSCNFAMASRPATPKPRAANIFSLVSQGLAVTRPGSRKADTYERPKARPTPFPLVHIT